ncbi:glycoside hydrolase [bacterium]|nr:glycoside hydrolase [bacterium]
MSVHSDQKIRLAFLWHQHQPFYKVQTSDGKTVYQMPWVRLHAVKDYYDIPRYLEDFPVIKQNFNLVPSLLIQLEDYVNQRAVDNILLLTFKTPNELTEPEKDRVLDLFFMANYDRLIKPHSRYHELWKKKQSKVRYSEQDWLDLQVWYNLCWVGPFWQEQTPFKELLAKGEHFSDEDKRALIEGHYMIMREVIPMYRRLYEKKQIELSVSPFYHCILPVLCDSAIAQECDPNLIRPEVHFKSPEDASTQLQTAVDYFRRVVGDAPEGMWPSEGSVSEEALGLIARSGIRWIATDEEILYHSEVDEKNKYRPYRFQTGNNEIKIVFRDHALSDSIGFRYAGMPPKDSVKEFIDTIEHIRASLIESGKSPENYMVSVILDGENCWEYYPENGRKFLKQLYTTLSKSKTIETCTISEFLKQQDTLAIIKRLFPGSWISHNFRIWIGGHAEKNLAWKYLHVAREHLIKSQSRMSSENVKLAWEEIYIAEGSDWFWWFGDDHHAHNKNEFDVLFRYHLMQVYKLIGDDVPEYLNMPIMKTIGEIPAQRKPTAPLYPKIDGRESHFFEWQAAGQFSAKLDGDTMSIINDWIEMIYYGFNEEKLFIRIDFVGKKIEKFKRSEKLALGLTFQTLHKVIFYSKHIESPIQCEYFFGNLFECAINLRSLEINRRQQLQLVVSVIQDERELIRMPSRDSYLIDFPDEFFDKYLWSV